MNCTPNNHHWTQLADGTLYCQYCGTGTKTISTSHTSTAWSGKSLVPCQFHVMNADSDDCINCGMAIGEIGHDGEWTYEPAARSTMNGRYQLPHHVKYPEIVAELQDQICKIEDFMQHEDIAPATFTHNQGLVDALKWVLKVIEPNMEKQ